MLLVFTLLVVLAVGFAGSREGLLTSLTTLVNVLIAGLLAFNFFEPIAAELEKVFQNSFLTGYEDALCLFALFSATLAGLRVLTNNLATQEVDLPAQVQQVASVTVSLVTGYLVAGFLMCMVQTLPLHDRFMGFDPTVEPQNKVRQYLPPDRVWLGMMHRASAVSFSQADSATFDPEGSFELRYARFRRIKTE